MAAFKPDCNHSARRRLGNGRRQDYVGSCMSIPEADFMDMAMRFIDIRKRVYTFPKMGEKAYFIASPHLCRNRLGGYAVCGYNRRKNRR